MTVQSSPRNAMGSATSSSTGKGLATSAFWDTWFFHARDAERQQILELANRQGVLYFHQLPTLLPNGKHGDPVEPTLWKLLEGGKSVSLPSFTCGDHDLKTDEFSPIQIEAIRRALASPDAFVLQSVGDDERSKVLAEILSRLARDGQRVLFLTRTQPRLDATLERLIPLADLPWTRLTEDGEDVGAPLSEWTLNQQKQYLRQRLQDEAKKTQEKTEEQARRLARENDIWRQLHDLAERWQSLNIETAGIEARKTETPAVLQAELTDPDSRVSPFRIAWEERQTRGRVEKDRWHREGEDVRGRLRELDLELAQNAEACSKLEPLAQAQRGMRFWTANFWRAIRENASARLATLEATRTTLMQNRDELRSAVETHQEREAETCREIERLDQEMTSAEAARRIQPFDDQLIELDRQRERLRSEWAGYARVLPELGIPEQPLNPPAFEGLRSQRKNENQEGELADQFQRQWVQYLEDASSGLIDRLASYSSVVAGTWTAWTRDQAEVPSGGFDVVLIDEAQVWPEAELSSAVALARRWILSGDTTLRSATCANPRFCRSHGSSTSCWARVCQQLCGDLRHFSCEWQRTEDGIRCQLLDLGPEDVEFLENETLSDAQDIELAILHSPGKRPSLASVQFPPRFSFSEAVEFFYRELQEVPLQPEARSALWEDTAEVHRWVIGAQSDGEIHRVCLGHGITSLWAEKDSVWTTVALEFAKTDGWNRARAQSWIAEETGFTDHFRNVILSEPEPCSRYVPQRSNAVTRQKLAESIVA